MAEKKGLLLRFFELLEVFLTDKSAEPASGDVLRFGFHKKINRTGYNKEADMQERVNRLKDGCHEIVIDPRWVSRDLDGDEVPETFCNRSLIYLAEYMGCGVFDPNATAEQIIRFAESSSLFRKGTGEEAHAHAMEGGFAFAGKIYHPHSHVAAIYPAGMGFSGSWGKEVPLCANVGRSPNGIKKTSQAFPVAKGEPSYFLLEGLVV